MSQYSPGMIQRIGHQQFYLSTNQPTYAELGVNLGRHSVPRPIRLTDASTQYHIWIEIPNVTKLFEMSANTEGDILRVFYVGNFFVADRSTSENSLIASIYLFAFFR